MAGLEGTVKTPIGIVQKKTALLLGASAIGVVGIAYYRQKKSQAAAQSVATAGTNEIDPATGYPYGSPEDAAALQTQNSYVSPSGGGGGASSIPANNIGYSSNSQWSQAAIQILTSNGSVVDATALSAALGAYLTGAYVTDTQRSLVQQAIAVAGYPPTAGPAGYPPSFNTQPTQTGLKPGTVTGLHATNVSASQIWLAWSPAANSRGYDLAWTDGHGRKNTTTSLDTTYKMINLPRNEHYSIQVRGKADTGSSTPGDWSAVYTVTTKAK